jgi:NADH dehydrogenase
MNVLVVGGTGFVGTHLCSELVDRGHEVTALSRSPEDADLPASVERVSGDATAYDSIQAAFEGRDAVVFLPALSPLFKPKGGDEMHFEIHLEGTENAVRAAEEHDVGYFLQMSALGADPTGETAYIRAKGQAEAVVRDSSLASTIFRPSVVFGEGGEFLRFTKLLAPPYFTALPGGGKTRFQPIWVGDLVPMLADAMEGETGEDDETEAEETADDEPTPAITRVDADADESEDANPHVGQAYDVGGPEMLTLAEIARLAHGADNKPVNVYNIPMGLAGIGLKLLDNVPGAPMGADQYRSLQFDNTTAENDVTAFGVDSADLRTLADYLDVDPAVATQTARA